MPVLIDVMATSLDAGGTDYRQYFTVDTAALDVPIDGPPLPGKGTLRPAGAWASRLSQNDHCEILSLGISLPYSFSLSSRIAYLRFDWTDGVNTGLVLGTSEFIELPFANYEMSLGKFFQFPAAAVGPISLVLRLVTSAEPAWQQTRISMLNTPAALEGAVLPVTVFAKIAHNLELVA